MKKRLALLLALLLVLSLVGCKKDAPAEKAGETKKEVAAEADTKDEKTEEAPKSKGMIVLNDENEDEVYDNLEMLSEERLDEVAKYFKENEEATKGMTYEEVEKIIGMSGIYDPELDDVIEEEGTIEKYVFWYSEERLLYVVFSTPKDSPDDLGLIDVGVYEGNEESKEN